jgi:outer membrane lipoprotein-sorting protein
MNNYNPKSYISRIVTDDPNSGKQMDVIEIKPVNRKTEFSKARISLGKVSGELVKMELFNKDGSRHTLTISKTSFSKRLIREPLRSIKLSFPDITLKT